MFGQTKNKRTKLEAKYRKLLEESFRLSHSNRKKSDEKRADAEAIRKQLDEMEDAEN